MDSDYQYKKLNKRIKEIRFNQDCTLKVTGCYVICGSLMGICIIENPTFINIFVLGIDLSMAAFYGIKSYKYQQKINNLNKEKNKIKCKLDSN